MHRTLLKVLLTWTFPFMTIHGQENRLANESSSYLKSAAHQPVDWRPWSEEAFTLAAKENKPILLDIGAVWCHWCHVMDMESYENPAIAALINENFIPIKVDRDERPDIDARYQAAVGAIAGQGGWPLTAFLLPDGRVFYGGTYFPPEDRYGRSGFQTVLAVLAKTYRNENQKVLDNATEVQHAVSTYLQKGGQRNELQESSIDTTLSGISRSFDIRNGGFGGAPKFPHTGAIELLLTRYDRTGEQWMIDAVTSTLNAMARGGIYDQLGGGFHRYSTDEKWIVPHFEKMLYDNAPLLSNYVHAYQATGNEFFKNVANEIIRFVSETLTDTRLGGFYASQDADVEFGDDGSYFTWTLEQASQDVTPDELEVLKLHYNIYEQGEMQHDSAQNVLFVDKSVQDISSILRKGLQQTESLLAGGKKKLQESRSRRKAPFVDKTVYATWNGMMISSYLEAAKALELDDVRAVSLKALDRILREHHSPEGLVTHRAASAAPEAFLEDQVHIAVALLKAYEVSGEGKYLAQAESLMNKTIEFFWDEQEDGFSDVPSNQRALGALAIQNKPVQDSPTEGANAVAALALIRLSTLTENPVYRSYAEKTLRCFSGTMQNFGVFAATYFLALDEFLNPPPHIVIVSELGNPLGERLFRKALQTYRPGKLVSRTEPHGTNKMPGVVKSMALSYSKPVAFVCTNFICAPPAFQEDDLVSTLKHFAKSNHVLK